MAISFAILSSAGVLIAVVMGLRRWLRGRTINPKVPSSAAPTMGERDSTVELSDDEDDTEFEDAVNEAVDQACKELRELARSPWFQMSAWHLADVVTDAVAAVCVTQPDDNDAEILIDSLNDSMHEIIRFPNTFRSHTAAVQACNRVDIATEATRRELNVAWCPALYASTPQANSTPSAHPARSLDDKHFAAHSEGEIV
ncbi:hypothetical protein [Rhodococcus qingshengii]|uniref:hypothetical protein n=1 Tax=Rhodococcus qingshengii TaxID=334542 RepID=UPI00237D132A|nr:hypothetical protein [Rhodococcus qingshengii]WCT06214.1 hypothetical protein PI247_31905 [Rhodococcus qingshengii]